MPVSPPLSMCIPWSLLQCCIECTRSFDMGLASAEGQQLEYLKWMINNICVSTVKMEQCALKNVNNYLSTNIYSWLETAVGKCSNLY